MSKLLDGFMREMAEPTEQLHGAAKDLNSSAKSLSEMAQQAKTQSVAVAAASEETAPMVQSAATAGDQLARTIAEVEARAIESSRLAAGAVNEVLQTNSTIDELAVVAKGISEVTQLINRIAGQTNLLASTPRSRPRARRNRPGICRRRTGSQNARRPDCQYHAQHRPAHRGDPECDPPLG